MVSSSSPDNIALVIHPSWNAVTSPQRILFGSVLSRPGKDYCIQQAHALRHDKEPQSEEAKYAQQFPDVNVTNLPNSANQDAIADL